MRGKVIARKSHARKDDRAKKSCAEVSARKCQRGNVSAEMSCAEVSVNPKTGYALRSLQKILIRNTDARLFCFLFHFSKCKDLGLVSESVSTESKI